jgi:hypothetical protein
VLTSSFAGARPGTTLAELLVALTLSALVLGTATTSLLRQRRAAGVVGGTAASAAQQRAATGALAAELSALAAGSGDLVAGATRDTALQLRALVVGGVACDDALAAATFADEDDGTSDALSGAVPKAGDTLWWYAGDSTASWRGRPVVASDSLSAPCMLTGSPARPARRVAVAGADTIPFGSPLRITRPARYSFYRSGDGSWQLGLHEWIEATHRFAPPQPIAGPFVARAGSERTGFRFFDAGGLELPAGAAGVDVGRVARVRVTVLGVDRSARLAGDTLRRDSVDVALQRARGW